LQRAGYALFHEAGQIRQQSLPDPWMDQVPGSRIQAEDK
jgi:hypothetical protein